MSSPLTHAAAPARADTLSRLEYWADFVIHVVGVTAGVVGAAVLLASVPDDAKLPEFAFTIYALGLVAMLTCSALYNTIRPPRPHSWLRRFDHAAIFLMIAGTCTPFALHGTPEWRLAALVVLWTVALAGAAMKLFAPGRFEREMLWLYVGLAWAGLASLTGEFASLPGSAATLLAAGAVLYTIGVFFHTRQSTRFSTAIWHGFVLVAAACHYFAVMTGIVLPPVLPV